jgi:putative polymerase
LASTDFFARPYPSVASERWRGRIIFLLILAAVAFNAGLSYLNAHVMAVNGKTVIFCEVLIVISALLVSLRALNITHICLILGVVLYTLTLALFRANVSPEAGVDVKIARDFLIPIVFFILGLRISDLKTADSIVFRMTILILGFALFEYFFLDTYLNFFNVIQYYIARGAIEDTTWALDVAGGLMVSGIRPADQGRNLLSFLGDHRVSSLFLEPISLGNFGCIVTMWAVIRSRMTGRVYIWSFLAAVGLIVLSDTRFDAFFLVLGIFLLLTSVSVSSAIAFALPVVAMASVIILEIASGGKSDDITGYGLDARLVYSGHVLLDFDILNWLGLKASRLQTFDAGYAYVISNAGLLGLGVFWWLFLSLKGDNRFFYGFRNASAAYFAALFCIGESQFTIKTAALHWFLMGALSIARVNEPERYVRAVGLPDHLTELGEAAPLRANSG